MSQNCVYLSVIHFFFTCLFCIKFMNFFFFFVKTNKHTKMIQFSLRYDSFYIIFEFLVFYLQFNLQWNESVSTLCAFIAFYVAAFVLSFFFFFFCLFVYAMLTINSLKLYCKVHRIVLSGLTQFWLSSHNKSNYQRIMKSK